MKDDSFLKGSERLVNPVTVGSVHFFQQMFGLLPLGVQRRFIEHSSATTPNMGFVVEPYAFFLFYKVADEKRAAGLLPEGFRLARASVFAGDEPACYAIISVFRVHASTFWGARAELYLVAEDERTGLLSWVIADYLSDTVSYDRANGLRAPSAPDAVVTTSADGRVVVDMSDPEGERALAFDAALSGASMRALDERLWVEGNLSVAYGPLLSPDQPGVFALTFPPEEMSEALDVDPQALRLDRMTWHADLLEDAPAKLACFPYAQHLLSDSPGKASGYASADELEQAVHAVDFDSIPAYSTGSTRKGMAVGTAATLAVVASLVIALILKK